MNNRKRFSLFNFYILNFLFLLVFIGDGLGQEIVYSNNQGGKYDIWVMNSDGSNKSNLSLVSHDPNNLYNESQPQWSPDGTKIAFVSNKSGRENIWIMSATGQSDYNLTNSTFQNVDPFWSPDGTKIYFVRNTSTSLSGCGPCPYYEIFVYNLQNNTETRLTTNSYREEAPIVSPDGQSVVYVKAESAGDCCNQTNIWKMNSDGTNQAFLFGNSGLYEWIADWGTINNKILFSKQYGSSSENTGEIVILNPDGTNPLRLTTNSYYDHPLCFSPDNSKILFNTNRSGTYEFWIMNSDGSNPVQLTIGGYGTQGADWKSGTGSIFYVTNSNPINGASNMPTTQVVEVTFNKSLDANSLKNWTFYISSKSGATTEKYTWSLNTTNDKIIFTPASAWSFGSEITIKLAGGIIKSQSGDILRNEYICKFTTVGGSNFKEELLPYFEELKKAVQYYISECNLNMSLIGGRKYYTGSRLYLKDGWDYANYALEIALNVLSISNKAKLSKEAINLFPNLWEVTEQIIEGCEAGAAWGTLFDDIESNTIFLKDVYNKLAIDVRKTKTQQQWQDWYSDYLNDVIVLKTQPRFGSKSFTGLIAFETDLLQKIGQIYASIPVGISINQKTRIENSVTFLINAFYGAKRETPIKYKNTDIALGVLYGNLKGIYTPSTEALQDHATMKTTKLIVTGCAILGKVACFFVTAGVSAGIEMAVTVVGAVVMAAELAYQEFELNNIGVVEKIFFASMGTFNSLVCATRDIVEYFFEDVNNYISQPVSISQKSIIAAAGIGRENIQLGNPSVNDVTINEVDIYGRTSGSILVANNSASTISVYLMNTVTSNELNGSTEGVQDISSTIPMNLNPGVSQNFNFSYGALRNSLASSAGYSLNINLFAEDLATKQIINLGPNSVCFNVGTSTELLKYKNLTLSTATKENMTVGEKTVAIALKSNTKKAKVILTYDTFSDYDLHLYNGINHVGKNYETGADEINIAFANFTGSDGTAEIIELNTNGGEIFSAKVVAQKVNNNSIFDLKVIEYSNMPALLSISPISIDLNKALSKVDFNIELAETGNSYGVNNIILTKSALISSLGKSVPAEKITIGNYNASLSPAGTMTIPVTIDLSSFIFANSEILNGSIAITATEGGTGTSLSRSVKFKINESNVDLANPTITLNRTSLVFGAVAGGNKTPAQTIILSSSSGGTLNWTASGLGSPNFLQVIPGQGTGNGIIQVDVNATGLAPGTYAGTVAITDPNATNSPQSVNVTLNVYAGGTTRPPIGSFDTPIAGSTVSSSVPVTGWVLDDIGLERVKIYRDPVTGEQPGTNGLIYIGDAIYVDGARKDIPSAYPDYPYNYKAGWGYMLLTNFLPPNQGNGTYTLHAIVTDYDGNTVELGTKTITCDNAHAVKPFGAIDTPTQGGEASGAAFNNFGWALTPLPNSIPIDGSTINVWVDGVAIGHPDYNHYRQDIATKFPGLANSNGAIGVYTLNTTGYANGVHTIAWSVVNSAGNTDGIGSRFFNILNTGGTQSALFTEAFDPFMQQTFDEIRQPAIDFQPVYVRTGFKTDSIPTLLQPNKSGKFHIEISEVDRVELDLGRSASLKGYSVIGKDLQPLPVGSTLDAKNGRFCWMPGPGFLGEYEFVFLKQELFGMMSRVSIIVKIKPKFEK